MEKFIEVFKQINNFDRDNNLEFEIHSPGHITYKMKILEKHLSSPSTSHGGAIAGFMDCVLGLAALSSSITRSQLTSTVEFKMNFIKPALLGDELIGTGKVIHLGKSLIISSAEIRCNDELVAMGQGTFNLYPMSKRDLPEI
ncbi:MAG: PaaI family thioesterase [Bacteriovoracaceae bacterium]